ncbi:MAG: hypothetical protein E7432_00760 [Ruminococcaceae bacterium]|nr:hypothetical protein [Oscillospiraceae bacterium]
MKKKNNIIMLWFAVMAVFVFWIGIESYNHGIHYFRRFASLSNPFFWTRAALVIAFLAVWIAVYYFIMNKLEPPVRCPHCSRITPVGKIKVKIHRGFLCEQKCPYCGKQFMPDEN